MQIQEQLPGLLCEQSHRFVIQMQMKSYLGFNTMEQQFFLVLYAIPGLLSEPISQSMRRISII
jgi:hypothetical protein